MRLAFRFHGLSDVGAVRTNNEVAWGAWPDEGFFALADGMGGHLAGEVAAKETVEQVSRAFVKRMLGLGRKEKETMVEAMEASIASANQWVYQMSRRQKKYAGMGTTLCCLYWTHEMVVYAHVGDSRIYRWRNHKLELLTKDHSLFEKWLGFGKRAQECKTPYPYKHVITKAIGTHSKLEPEIAVCTYEPGDLFLLCTDGLSDVVSTMEMQEILCKATHLEEAAEKLIQQSKFKGSSDNITVLMIQCMPEHDKNLFRQQFNDGPRSARV
ncbi:MAG TPA: serine/threonine-protein phosphatase [Parachlamydiales bacterium]|nr:serine/threonine-protein phosphatase [Parachlamydiales bacterium]